VQTREGKHLFVGIDTTIATAGLYGPTNLFGHPTDQLLESLDRALSQWNNSNQFKTSEVTKIVFGHFPLSFTALTETQKNLKDVFSNHSISAYLCGHLHGRFGKNLKRHHLKSQNEYFQFNMHEATHQVDNDGTESCQKKNKKIKEFWEWEMGDWRSHRSIRILAIDSGDVSFVDLNLRYGSRDIIILPTFPLDSRLMQRISTADDFKCLNKDTRKYETIRALVFSKHKLTSVEVKVYDSSSGILNLVLDSEMRKMEAKEIKRGELYSIPWNWRAFVDPSPDRYWLKIEATDVTGETVSTPLRPFSINGLSSKLSWSWIEFFVIGCQWATIYYPALWVLFAIAFMFLLVQKLALAFLKNHNIRGKNSREYLMGGLVCLFTELPRMGLVWSILFVYLVYLLLLPWIFGYAIEDGNLMYMTYRGWYTATLSGIKEVAGLGFPDVMVIALPHLVWVVLPAILVVSGLAAEAMVYKISFLSFTGKKNDDDGREQKAGARKELIWSGRWIRKFLLLFTIAIFWKHWKVLEFFYFFIITFSSYMSFQYKP
jgi:hypothetical protein